MSKISELKAKIEKLESEKADLLQQLSKMEGRYLTAKGQAEYAVCRLAGLVNDGVRIASR